MKRKYSYDFYLVLATAVMLFVISAICIYGMFYFKLAQIHQMATAAKTAHMNHMNTVMAPFLIVLILLLGICVPKRLFPTRWLHGFTALLLVLGLGVSWQSGIKTGLMVVLAISLVLQAAVLVMAVMGSKRLAFEKKGYWLQVGSSLIHLGIILFVLDLFFYKRPTVHLWLFWTTTVATVLGMFFCFYSDRMVRLAKRMKPSRFGDKP